MKKRHILTLLVSTVIVAVLTIGTFASLSSRDSTQTGSVVAAEPLVMATSSEIEAEINKFRDSKGLQPIFSDSAVLDDAAQVRAESMCADNDWSHDKAWEVLDKLYTYSYASENLYYDFFKKDQAAEAVKVWSESPGHLENMMKDHVEMGVGITSCPGFQGNPNAVIVTNYFGVPR